MTAEGRIIYPYHPYPRLFYTYVDAEDQTGLQNTPVHVGGDYNPQSNPEGNGGISQPQQQIQPEERQIQPWRPQMNYQSRHGSPPAAETPPSYEDATTQEQRDKFNLMLSEKYRKTFSTLQAAGETLADYYASERFDSPQAGNSKAEVGTSKAESSKVESSKAENSKVEMSKAETSRIKSPKAVTKQPPKELNLLEQKREVKGLRSDLKLWAIWVCPSSSIIHFLDFLNLPSPPHYYSFLRHFLSKSPS